MTGTGETQPADARRPPGVDRGDVPHGLATSLDDVVRALRGPGASVLAGLFGRWDEVVGPAIAAHATPTGLRDGVLVVEVDHPSWATEMRFLEAELVRRLREATGDERVTRLEIRVRHP